MRHVLQQLLAPAAAQRATLLMNHVLASEDVAMARLKPHAGCCIRLHFEGWPALLPALPVLVFVITPAGLLEWCGDETRTDVDLTLEVEASNPALEFARSLAGEAARIRVTGDAALATDMSWITDNLSWDVQDDLAAIVGPSAAHELARVGRGVTAALRAVMGRVLRRQTVDADTAGR
jgi:ubiquinone biosynthesis accessory factor UbiJ